MASASGPTSRSSGVSPSPDAKAAERPGQLRTRRTAIRQSGWRLGLPKISVPNTSGDRNSSLTPGEPTLTHLGRFIDSNDFSMPRDCATNRTKPPRPIFMGPERVNHDSETRPFAVRADSPAKQPISGVLRDRPHRLCRLPWQRSGFRARRRSVGTAGQLRPGRRPDSARSTFPWADDQFKLDPRVPLNAPAFAYKLKRGRFLGNIRVHAEALPAAG